MWVFGYGSLMWDDWFGDLRCLVRKRGILQGYHRIFNKESSRNWGTRENPGPTLNLTEGDQASCQGVLFEFPDTQEEQVLAKLRDREGAGFEFPTMDIQMCSRSAVRAIVPLYRGKNLIQNKSTEELADMIIRASGKNGNCRDYVLKLDDYMKRMQISDPVVGDIATCIRQREGK